MSCLRHFSHNSNKGIEEGRSEIIFRNSYLIECIPIYPETLNSSAQTGSLIYSQGKSGLKIYRVSGSILKKPFQ